MSSTKGFWASVTGHASNVTGEKESLRVTPDVTPQKNTLRDAYIAFAQTLRPKWNQIPTPTGRRKRGPKYIAVTLCAQENEYGLTDSGQSKGKRWACKTCLSFAPSVWADGTAPSREEQEQEWADYMAKGNREVIKL